MFAPVLVTAPTDTPVNLGDIEAQVEIEPDDNEKEWLIESYIAAATAYLDGWSGILGRCLVTQTWRQDYASFSSQLRLPLAPVASITSVKYLNASGVETTIAAGNYALRTDEDGAYVEFDQAYSQPALVNESGPRVSVTYVAGTSADDVPMQIKQAIMLLVAHWFRNREAVNVGNIVSDLPLAFESLIMPLRRPRF